MQVVRGHLAQAANLGKVQRELLCEAQAGPVRITRCHGTSHDRRARHRAAERLAESGLVELYLTEERQAIKMLRLTDHGSRFIADFHDELIRGTRISLASKGWELIQHAPEAVEPETRVEPLRSATRAPSVRLSSRLWSAVALGLGSLLVRAG